MVRRRNTISPVSFIVFVLLVSTMLVGCGVDRDRLGMEAVGTTSQEEAPSRDRIKLLANDHPWIHHTREHISDFTGATGITVDIEVYPEEQFRTKRTVEMLSGISEFDLFMIMPGNSLSEYHNQGWVEPLDRFIDGMNGTAPSLPVGDIYPAALAAGVRDGLHYTIPILLETSILAYNREIFNRFDLVVPRTLAELEETARLVYERSGGRIYGITMRGRGASATSQWVDFLHSYGGSWVDRDGDAAIHSAESLMALETYGRLLRLYGPRDATGNGWYESLSVFIRGQAAMIFDANVFRNHYEDPEQSAIAGNVGYAVLPAGPSGSVPHISHWGLAIYAGSVHKDEAWSFIAWAASRERALSAHRAGIPSALESVWQDPQVMNNEDNTEWINASIRSYEIATHRWNPPVIQVDDARTAVGAAIVAAILDQDLPAAAEEASRRIDSLQKILE